MKTAITVLQEMMVKLAETPEYECISQSGPNHLAMFEYRCVACEVVVTASARSKKEAKQNAARLMLHKLSLNGHHVPPPFGLAPNFSTQSSTAGGINGIGLGGTGPGGSTSGVPVVEAIPIRSYVALLKELCDTFMLPAVDYELVGDTGPPHLRHFTMRARMGLYERCSTATTKKAARQNAAEQLYNYLRENMPRITADFNEKEALVRAHEKAMERYVEIRNDGYRRPDLSQKVSDYHLGLSVQTDEKQREKAKSVAYSNVAPEEAEAALLELVTTLGLTIEYGQLECAGGALCVLELVPTSPPLAFAGASRAAASLDALRYVPTALSFAPAHA